MGKILLIALGIILVFSYFKFRMRHSMDLKMVQFLERKSKEQQNDIHILLSLASAYTIAELYAKAHALYKRVQESPNLAIQLSNETSGKIEANSKFCEKPLPWSNGIPKDHHTFRYLHYFFLRRFGGRRYVFLRDVDVLAFNTYMRMKGN